MRTVLSSQGRLVLPAALRAEDGIQPGDQFEIERLAAGKYLLKKLPVQDELGIVD